MARIGILGLLFALSLTGTASADTDACLGASARSCMALLKATVPSIRHDDYMFWDLAQIEKGHGHPDKSGENEIFTGFKFPDMSDNIIFEATLNPQRIVDRVRFILPVNPALAQTVEDFRKSGVYPALRLTVGPHCADLADEATLLRVFQSSVRTAIKRTNMRPRPTIPTLGVDDVDETPDIDFCGRKLALNVEYGQEQYDPDDTRDIEPYTLVLLTLR